MTTLHLPCLIAGHAECLTATADPLTQTITVELGTGDTATLAAGQLVRLLDCLRVEQPVMQELLGCCVVCGEPIPHLAGEQCVCPTCLPF
jgi:hypothetical protein